MPDKLMMLFLDIEGYCISEGGFDVDMTELQTVFLPDFLTQFLSEIHCPLFNASNCKQWKNVLPLELVIK